MFPKSTHIKWQHEIIATTSINLGTIDVFSDTGYCMLCAYLIMDILYQNVNVHKNCEVFLKDDDMFFQYIKVMLKYIVNSFPHKKYDEYEFCL